MDPYDDYAYIPDHRLPNGGATPKLPEVGGDDDHWEGIASPTCHYCGETEHTSTEHEIHHGWHREGVKTATADWDMMDPQQVHRHLYAQHGWKADDLPLDLKALREMHDDDHDGQADEDVRRMHRHAMKKIARQCSACDGTGLFDHGIECGACEGRGEIDHEHEDHDDDDDDYHHMDHSHPVKDIFWNAVAAGMHLQDAHGYRTSSEEWYKRPMSQKNPQWRQGDEELHEQLHAQDKIKIPHNHGDTDPRMPDAMRSEAVYGDQPIGTFVPPHNVYGDIMDSDTDFGHQMEKHYAEHPLAEQAKKFHREQLGVKDTAPLYPEDHQIIHDTLHVLENEQGRGTHTHSDTDSQPYHAPDPFKQSLNSLGPDDEQSKGPFPCPHCGTDDPTPIGSGLHRCGGCGEPYIPSVDSATRREFGNISTEEYEKDQKHKYDLFDKATGKETGPTHWRGDEIHDANHYLNGEKTNFIPELGLPAVGDVKEPFEKLRRERALTRSGPFTPDTKQSLNSKTASNLLQNPMDGSNDWHHGTPHSYEKPGEYSDEDSYNDDYVEDNRHWNTLLGEHWTGHVPTAHTFAKGLYHNEGSRGQKGYVHTANLGITNPKPYKRESDMDEDAFDHAWDTQDHHDPHEVHGNVCEDDKCHSHDNHESWDDTDTELHSYYKQHAGNWLTTHPDKQDIADKFRNSLEKKGHDGIIYGNEIEGPHLHPCAINFRANQVQNHRMTPGGGPVVDNAPDWDKRKPAGRSLPMTGAKQASSLDDALHEYYETLADTSENPAHFRKMHPKENFVNTLDQRTPAFAPGTFERHVDEQIHPSRTAHWTGEHDPIQHGGDHDHHDDGSMSWERIYHDHENEVPSHRDLISEFHPGESMPGLEDLHSMAFRLVANPYSDYLKPEYRDHQDQRKGYQPGDQWNPDESYANTIGWVKTDHLKHLMEFDRENEDHPHTQGVIGEIHKELSSGRGFTDPLILKYHHDTHQGLIGEGNHRLAAAIRAGIPAMPVRGVRAYAREAQNGSLKPMQGEKQTPLGDYTTDHLGNYRQPDLQHPKDIFPPEAMYHRPEPV